MDEERSPGSGEERRTDAPTGRAGQVQRSTLRAPRVSAWSVVPGALIENTARQPRAVTGARREIWDAGHNWYLTTQ